MSSTEPTAYRAFISYSHADKKWGDWLHRSLETYRVPRPLIGQPSRSGSIPKRLYPIFRDREELPTATSLTDQIQQALEYSEYLIVICSPRSAQSRWVNEEILAFKRLGKSDRILALVIDGEPNGSDKPGLENQECFPPALRYELGEDGELSNSRTEPIAADARPGKDGRKAARLKLISGLLGVKYDLLAQRDRKRQKQRQLTLATISLIVFVSFYGLWYQGFIKEQRKEQLRLLEESSRLASLAQQQLDKGYYDRAALLALEGLPGPYGGIDRPYSMHLEVLLRLAHSQMLKLAELPYSGEAVGKISFSRDSSKIVTADHAVAGFTVTVWDVQSGKAIFEEHIEGLTEAHISPRGDELLTIGNSVSIWDIESGVVLETLETLEKFGDAVCGAFHPEGEIVGIGGMDGEIRIWNRKSGNLIRATEHNETINSLEFSPDGTLLAAVGDDGKVSMFELQNRRKRWVKSHEDIVWSVGFKANGKALITASPDGTARIWDTRTGEELGRFEHEAPVVHAEFSPDAELVLTASSDGSTMVWDAETGEEMAVLEHGDGAVRHGMFDREAKRVVTAGENGNAVIWDIESEGRIAELTHEAEVWDAKYSPDGTRIATVSYDQPIAIWGVRDGKMLPIVEYWEDIGSVISTPNGDTIVTESEASTATAWDAQSGDAIFSMEHESAITAARLDAKGRRLITGTVLGVVSVWDLKTGERLATTGRPGKLHELAVNDDASRIAGAYTNQTIIVWDRIDERINVLTEVSHHGQGHPRVWLTPSGDRLVTATMENQAIIWDIRSGKQIAELVHDDWIAEVAFWPSRGEVATTSKDGTVGIWKLETGERLATLRIGEGGLTDSPSLVAYYEESGQYILTNSWDSIVMWDLRSLEQVVATSLRNGSLKTMFSILSNQSGQRWIERVAENRVLISPRLVHVEKLLSQPFSFLPLNRTCLTAKERKELGLRALTTDEWLTRGCEHYATSR